MTTYTDHGLVCLDGNDYNAIALALQTDAIAADTALDSISDSFDQASIKPYRQMVTALGNGPVSSSGEQEYSIGSWSTVSSTIPETGSSTLPGNISTMIIPRTGWYEYGAFVNLLAAGAVTAFSRRTLFVTAWTRPGATAVQLSQIVWRTADTSTAGGEFLTASGGSFYATAAQTVELTGTWSHANLASDVSSISGARAWVHFIGSGIEIGSA